MNRKSWNINWNFVNRFGRQYYSKQINRIIFVLVILLIVLVLKLMDTKATNSIVSILERNVYYNFSIKEDGIKAKTYLKERLDSSKITVEEFTKEIIKKRK